MKASIRTWLISIPVIVTAGLVVAEKSNLLQSDSITAVACTRELFIQQPEPASLLLQYRSALLAEAQRYDLPPELLAAIIYGHQRDLTPFRKFTDCAGSAVGADLSLGLAQIRVSNAATNDNVDFAAMPPAEFKRYRAMLLDPVQNIAYEAKELRQLLERDIRSPGISADELVHAPFVMTLLMSEYRAGRQPLASGESRLSGNAFFDLRSLLNDSVFIFGRDAEETMRIQNAVDAYLDYIHCESGIFNPEVCEDWRHRARSQ